MIFLSAGHHYNEFGADPGAIANGFKEADLAKELRDLVCDELTRRKHSYIVDRDSETLSQYIRRIRPGSGSVVCEIHFNAASPSATGAETLIGNKHTIHERRIAQDMNNGIVKALGIRDRGVKTESDSHRKYLAILHTRAGISLLPEICFITNKEDMIAYNKYKGQLAVNMADVLIKAENLHT